ncbi:type II toxin-antitoxin system HicA family toxin [Merdibacter massiliensis]|uniref:type II toxin-antitoxin system HicA family toxin n=1 Tax=Merdibacter massiliensis TaxID=1871030 RepID=UPI00096A9B3B|nr:type II toxin-antitoxin system HicA family toxin [Merdibacter massiliensis]
MPMTPKQMVKLLKQNGFRQIRSCGSHVQFYNDITGKRTTVAMHCKDLPKGTERKILKDAGLL